ncbi:MAG: hypothetical protein KDD67_07595 [Ignavibacteriae bacterium]|nr:hypothetical protein [Ignavibacteriota bacterium]MCB9216180.1 hypothetical protein [Ignavibacteria bacterium]
MHFTYFLLKPQSICSLLSLMLFACGADIRTESTPDSLQLAETEYTMGYSGEFALGAYDTVQLSGGCRLIYRVVLDTFERVVLPMQQIELWKDSLIAVPAGVSYGLHSKNLGYVEEDFPDYFLLVQRFGSGNPKVAMLIEKATGESMIDEEFVEFVDLTSDGRYLLYIDDLSERRLGLAEVYTNHHESYDLPPDALEVGWYNDITVQSISKQRLEIEYTTEDRKTKRHIYKH